MNNDPLISLVIPCYNSQHTLRKCLDSVIQQSYTNLEIILVDDGSPDNCGKICDEYAKKDSKRIDKDLPPSSLMFHNIQSSNVDSFSKFIEDELTINKKEEQPYDEKSAAVLLFMCKK